jgi:surface carbohydrate biosynthesis protein (TIGR04326 family)
VINSKKNLIIWDLKETPPEKLNLLHWRGYLSGESYESILNLVEENAIFVRSEYLSFIHELGFGIKIREKNLIEHLEISEGLSLWWMTLLAEKSPFRSDTVQNCLRLIALKKYLIENSFTSIELVTSDSKLQNSISNLCELLKLNFISKKPSTYYLKFLFGSLRKKITFFLYGFYYLLRKIVEIRWKLSKKDITYSNQNSVFLFSYFDNVNFTELKKGNFISSYWNDFPSFLKENDYELNWMHFSILDKKSTLRVEEKYLRKASNSFFFKENHLFVDTFLSFKVLFTSFFRWIGLILKVGKLNSRIKKELVSNNLGWFWPIIEEDWILSIYGVNAIQNLIWVNQFDLALRTIPKQKLGLFLCENQNWERAFVHFWNKYEHGNLIGILHTPLIFWDLRLLESRDLWKKEMELDKPLPDFFALCGKTSVECYKEASQSEYRLLEVESLRYQHLRRKVNTEKDYLDSFKKEKKINALIIGSVMPETTNKMMEALNSEPDFSNKLNLTVKPHPDNPINILDFTSLDLKLSNEPVEKLLSENTLAISTIYTTASLEAYCAGLKVLTFLDPDELNFSPLKGKKNAEFFNHGNEIKLLIQNLKPSGASSEEFFFLNPEYPKWKQIIEKLA